MSRSGRPTANRSRHLKVAQSLKLWVVTIIITFSFQPTVCVCICVCVSHMVQWYVQRFPIDRLRVRFPTIMVTHVFLLFHRLFLTFLSFSWVVTNSQCMPEYVVWCVCRKRKKEKKKKMEKWKIGIHWPEKVTSNSCVVDTRLKIVAVNSSALQAVGWCNPSTSCYV